MKRKFDFWSVLAMCLCTAVLSMGLIYGLIFHYIGGMEGYRIIDKLITVKTVVDERYVGEADWDKAIDLAAAAMVEATGDRWSYYLTAEEYEAYVEQSNNSINGIGVTVEVDGDGRGIKVLEVIENSPAYEAGVRPGCIITAVDGQNIAELSLSEVTAIIRTRIGEYSLVYINENGEECSSLVANRLIFTSPTSHEMMEEEIGYIRIENFENGAASGVKRACTELLEQGARGLIIDVRQNPGGQLFELTDMLDEFLPEGEMFISVDSEGVEEIDYSDANCLDVPIVVLIDENTYSAAEFFAAALKEYDKAVIMGTASTGKARSQQNFTLSDGSVVHISTRNYLTPNRVNLAEAGGLVPDVEVAPVDGIDAALEKALEYLS